MLSLLMSLWIVGSEEPGEWSGTPGLSGPPEDCTKSDKRKIISCQWKNEEHKSCHEKNTPTQ